MPNKCPQCGRPLVCLDYLEQVEDGPTTKGRITQCPVCGDAPQRTELVETLAKAMCAVILPGRIWHEDSTRSAIPERTKLSYRDMARAALKALNISPGAGKVDVAGAIEQLRVAGSYTEKEGQRLSLIHI